MFFHCMVLCFLPNPIQFMELRSNWYQINNNDNNNNNNDNNNNNYNNNNDIIIIYLDIHISK